jgi:ribosomal protein S18 acetylase RimI-like enzyme
MPEGFREKKYEAGTDDLIILKLLNKCGFMFSQRELNSALDICVPGGVHLIEEVKSGKVVSMMMSRHLASEEFPFGGRIDWLVTDGEYRGLGLGKSAAKLAANLLISRGYKNIWVTTQIFRANALNIFLDIGFLPTKKNSQIL